MQFSIILDRRIQAPPSTVWQILNDTTLYSEWNPFVIACESSFDAGSPIIMKVKLIPFFSLKQKETVRIHEHEKLIEYGIDIPFLLHSSRKHILKNKGAHTQYQSFFQLRGLLAPVVGFLMGRALNKGFAGMTDGLVKRAESQP